MSTILDFLSQHWMELLSAVLGVIYMIQQSKTSAWMWATGTIMPVIKLFVDFDAGLYADFGMQIYYILIAVYGFWMWQRKVKVVPEGDVQQEEIKVLKNLIKELQVQRILLYGILESFAESMI